MVIKTSIAITIISKMKKLLTPGGMLVPNSGHGGMSYVIRSFLGSFFSSKIAGMKVAALKVEDFNFLKGLIGSGKLKPCIDSMYELERTPEAIAHLDSGKVKGKIVIKVADE